MTWDFAFQCEQDAERTELVELQIAEGGCPIKDPVVFETVKSSWDKPASRPQGLPAGLYAFKGTARDAKGQPIASRCESVQLPVRGVITLNLQGASSCAGSDGELDDAGTSESKQDGGTAMDDAAASDAAEASVPDAGDDCLDDGDRDNDRVANCVDGCPDDPMKVAEGQCGCGKPDKDQDGDGASNCVDECPVDENKTQAGTCGCNPKTMLLSGETLSVGQYLCGPRDDSVRFAMEEDGHLRLRVDGLQVWASDKTGGVLARMQGDGNLVIRTSSEAAAWDSKTVYKVNDVVVHDVSFLSVLENGTVTISSEDKVVWTRPQ